MGKRHFYGFQTSHSGAFWTHRDGSTYEAGMLHRFTTEQARAEWVDEDGWATSEDRARRNTRRAVATRDLPHGWTIHPYGGTTYIDHKAGGETTEVSYEQYLGWRKVEV